MTMVAKFLADGHTDSVICLAQNKEHLASGAEDHHVCLWSKEGKIKSKLYLQDDVTSICFQSSNPNILYAASGQKINLIDVRDFTRVQNCKEFSSEEINEVVINQKETFIATCDDSGDVKVIDLREMQLFKTLKRHTNICSSVKFHPIKGCELVSGSLDCNVISWDFMKGRSLSYFNTKECTSRDDDSIPDGMYMVNPPLVHSLAISVDGLKVMCGLENSRIQVLRMLGRGKFESLCTLKGHTRGVSNVKMIQGRPEEILVSGGNDGKVILWKSNEKKPNHKRKKDRNKQAREEEAKGGGMEDGKSLSSHMLLAMIDHGSKINCLTSAVVDSKTVVYVADQSEVISLYDVSESFSTQS